MEQAVSVKEIHIKNYSIFFDAKYLTEQNISSLPEYILIDNNYTGEKIEEVIFVDKMFNARLKCNTLHYNLENCKITFIKKDDSTDFLTKFKNKVNMNYIEGNIFDPYIVDWLTQPNKQNNFLGLISLYGYTMQNSNNFFKKNA